MLGVHRPLLLDLEPKRSGRCSPCSPKQGVGCSKLKKNEKMHLVVHKNSLHFHNIYEKLEVFDGWRAMACIMVNLPDFHAIKSCKLDNLANIDERQSD